MTSSSRTFIFYDVIIYDIIFDGIVLSDIIVFNINIDCVIGTDTIFDDVIKSDSIFAVAILSEISLDGGKDRGRKKLTWQERERRKKGRKGRRI
jgi:hypothetical protein